MQTKVIERIRNEINIVEIISEYFNLTKKGNNFVSICPFHEDSHPSLTISSTKQIFKCFACGQGGDVISFVSEYEKITLQEAIKKLASKLGLDIAINKPIKTYSEKDVKILNVLKDANDFFMNFLMTQQGEKALQYTKSRQLTNNLIERFKIGFSPQDGLISYLKSKNHNESDLINASLMVNNEAFFKNRLTFAIENTNGDIIGFSGRAINHKQEPKYLNSSESFLFNKSNILYNFYNAKKTMDKLGEVIIVEGFMDVIALAKAQINHAVALMGTNFSQKHIELLSGYKVILMLDNDKAGLKATLNAIKTLVKNKISVQIVENKTNLDPDEIFNSGPKLLSETIKMRVSWIEFVYQILLPKTDATSVMQIENFINEFKDYLLLSNQLEWEFYLNKISQYFNLSIQTVMAMLPSRIKQQTIRDAIKVRKKNQEINIKPKNYSYALIRSMLKNPQFISLFKNSNLTFSDDQLILIGKYLIKHDKTTVIPLKIKEKCREILNESDQVANSNDEFQEYIDRIKWTNNQRVNEKIIESIKRISDPNIAIQLLEEQIKLKRGK